MAPLAVAHGSDFAGAWPSLLAEIAQRSGCSVQMAAVPKARIDLQLLGADPPDLVLPATRSDERDRVAVFVPFLRQDLVLLSRQSEGIAPNDVFELQMKRRWRTAAARGYLFGSEYKKLLLDLDAQQRVDRVGSVDTVLQMLRLGRIQFAVLPRTIAAVAQGGDLRMSELGGIGKFEIGAYLSKTSLGIDDLATLRAAIQLCATQGATLASLRDRHMGTLRLARQPSSPVQPWQHARLALEQKGTSNTRERMSIVLE